MSQILRLRTRKDGNAKGVAIRKTPETKNRNTLQTLFQMAFNEHLKRLQNGESTNQTA